MRERGSVQGEMIKGGTSGKIKTKTIFKKGRMIKMAKKMRKMRQKNGK